MNLLRWIARCRRHPSAILLFVQLAGMVLYPFIENTEVGRIGFGGFGIAVLIFTTAMVRITPAWTWVSVCIAVPAIVLQVLQEVLREPGLLAWSAALETAFYFYAAAALIAYRSADREASTDELFAAAAPFTVLAWSCTGASCRHSRPRMRSHCQPGSRRPIELACCAL